MRKNCFRLNDETIKINPSKVDLEWFKNRDEKNPKKHYKGNIAFLFEMFPSGNVGYRIILDGEELTTIYYDKKEKRFKVTNW